ncbi:MAG: hypothetical protein JJT99_09710 [Rhodobacteraceae bacterium]|nr:hypothetical protein [Paracoccaceae bacterium]
MIRPELRAALSRWSEVMTGLAIAVLGLWAMPGAQGGFFQGLAALVALTGLGLAAIGWRRLRFHQGGEAPGVVQIVEGQISYFGPETGGFLGIDDLVALHLLAGGHAWRLEATGGDMLDIPTAAKGADALFDVFATLPGMQMQAVLHALEDPSQARIQTVWQHPDQRRGSPALPRR